MSGEPSPDAGQHDLGPRGAARPLIHAVVSHHWVVLFVALATLAGGALYLAARKPDYQASVMVLFTPLQSGDGAGEGLPLVVASADPTRDAQTAVTLLGGPQAAALAAKRLGRGWNARRVTEATTILQMGESNTIAVEGRATTRPLAVRVASAYARASLDVRRAVLRRDALALVPSVSAPAAPDDTVAQARRAEVNLLLGGADPNFSPVPGSSTTAASPTAASASTVLPLALLGGLALGIVAAILLETFSNRLRDSDELRELYPAPVLGYVPPLSGWHRGAIDARARSGEATAAMQLLASRLEAGAHGSQVVLATGASLGDGTTTTLLHLASALAASGREVLLLDFDLRSGDATRRLGLERESGGLTRILTGTESFTQSITPAPWAPGLQVLAAGAEHRPASMTGLRLREVLEQARGSAEFVLVDTAPLAEASEIAPALRYVDEILVMARPGHTRRADLVLLRDLLDASGATAVNMVVVGERSWRGQASFTAAGGLDERVPAPSPRAARFADSPASSKLRPPAT